jgi:hypothetical protein
MDLGLGGAAGRAGSGGGGTRGMSGGGGGGGSGSGRNSTFALGGGGASAAAWTRLVSSGVEDELVFASGGGGGCAGAGAGGLPQGHFLEACFLCRKPLASNRDIFMYRFVFVVPLGSCCLLPASVRSLVEWFWNFLEWVPRYGHFQRLWKVNFSWGERKIDRRISCSKSGSRRVFLRISFFLCPCALTF